MMAGHLNGSGPKPGKPDNVASLDEARRRAAERVKQEKRATHDARVGGAMSTRDWIIGAVLIAMALGMLWVWLSPLLRATGLTR